MNYDNEILKSNIERLRKKNGLSQDQLAKIAGIHQSRMSVLLNEDSKARFSIEQIYLIAEYFDVSIDSLVKGEESKRINTSRQICEFLVQLFESNNLDYKRFSREEKTFTPSYYIEDGYMVPSSKSGEKTISYNALFFPSTWQLNPEREYSEDELDAYYDTLEFDGNLLLNNIAINKFLDAYIPIYKLYSSDKMPKHSYDYTVKSLLENIKNTGA